MHYSVTSVYLLCILILDYPEKLNFNKENCLYNLIKVWGIRLKLPLVQYVCINAGMCMCLCVCIGCIGGSIVRFSFLLEIYSLQFHNSFDSCLNFDHFLCYVLHNYSQNSKKKKKKKKKNKGKQKTEVYTNSTISIIIHVNYLNALIKSQIFRVDQRYHYTCIVSLVYKNPTLNIKAYKCKVNG